MSICRLIFRKDIGKLLVKVIYDSNDQIPDIHQEIQTFSQLNGYNEHALKIIDIPQSDSRFEDIINALDITLKDDNLIPIEYPTLHPTELSDPIIEKLNLLIQMILEKEGII